mmetsp:Transcript_57918/g.147043  ORF Transcript_57918/g.147043 Transcript_57918/m.147043 type:complete len:229 (+) Transcript_57918:142-828(+)
MPLLLLAILILVLVLLFRFATWAFLFPRCNRLVVLRLQLRGLVLERLLLSFRQGLPLRAGEPRHGRGTTGAGLGRDGGAVLPEVQPVGTLRLLGLARSLPGILPGLLGAPSPAGAGVLRRLGLGLLGPALALHAASRDELLHLLLVVLLKLGRLVLEGFLGGSVQPLPPLAGQLADLRSLATARLLHKSLAVLAEPDPVGVLRLAGLGRVRHPAEHHSGGQARLGMRS